jgi:hypothetical protein
LCIEQHGDDVNAWQSKIGVDLSLWFRKTILTRYVAVRRAQYPNLLSSWPDNLAELEGEHPSGK